jgi:hypothetical protein
MLLEELGKVPSECPLRQHMCSNCAPTNRLRAVDGACLLADDRLDLDIAIFLQENCRSVADQSLVSFLSS